MSKMDEMEKQPKFSVVTVNLNNLEGLRKTRDSLFSQSLGDFEWLVIDALSGDGSVELVKAMKDDRIFLLSERDRGLYDGMNKGWDRAKGEFVIFMNSGDSFADSEVLRKISDFLKLSSLDIIYGDAMEVGKNETMIKRAMPHWLNAYSMFTHHQSIFYRRAFVGERRYDISFKRVADWALTATLLNQGAKAKHVNLIICHFERGGISQVPEGYEQGKREMIRYHKEILHLPPLVSKIIVGIKFFVNDFRKRWPKAYDFIRSKI